jgi:hypothetical protein
MLPLYQKIVEFIKPMDTVYCLGDCGDRGIKSWETIKAVAANLQFNYIRGNHEDMLADAMIETWNNERISPTDPRTGLLVYNGGYETLESWFNEGADLSWVHTLKNLPIHMEYRNEQGVMIYMTHAGYTPKQSIVEDADLLWDRAHITDEWPEGRSTTLILHGHYPNQLLSKKLGINYSHGVLWYANDHKACIDCGSYQTKETVLLDLDTFDEHIFMMEEN